MAKLNGEGREKNWAWIVSSEKARTYWGEADPEALAASLARLAGCAQWRPPWTLSGHALGGSLSRAAGEGLAL
ncbi:uncharacterized protein TrAFT101_009334 [Trichoderma asperellum]|uniref:uncharacterized protein n=1 Tax=Trichoderma asperellum TaxID=101201 RepID=UPI003328B7AE|nr:hypothetical protein TrAFT101_009334 [Trichoderma asperellum]